MNTRLIAIISSIAVLSSATSSTETVTTPVPGKGGITFSAVSSTSQTTLNPSSLPSTSTTSHTAIPSQSPPVSINSTLTPTISITTPDKTTSNATKPNNSTDNNMNKTTIHTPYINNSSESGENTTDGPSGRTEAPVPVTNSHTTIETSTKILCNCSEYVTTSPATKAPQTSTKSPNITMAPSANMSQSLTTKAQPIITTTTPNATSLTNTASPTPNATLPTAIVPPTNTTLPTTTGPLPNLMTSSTTNQSSTTKPSTNKPSTAKPSTNKPSTAKPSTNNPPTAKPSTNKPSTNNPSTAKPSTKKTSTAKPLTNNPSTAKPSTNNLPTAKPSTNKPSTNNPPTAKPSTNKPSTNNPSTAKPSTNNPPTAKPSTNKPSTNNPSTAKPSTNNPSTAKPSTNNPPTAKPSTNKPSTNNPSTAKPSTKKPPTAKPLTNNPSTAKPSANNPSTAKPSTAKPSTNNPSTAKPSTNKPSISTTALQTPSSTTTNKRKRRGVVNVEIDEIQSEDISDVYDDTSSYDLYCMNQCNITMNETTTEPPLTTTERPTTTTPKPTTTTPRHRSINLSGKLVDLNLVIVVMGNFTEDLNNHSSKNYINLAKQYKTSLNQFYSSLLPAEFKKIVFLNFSEGSIKCNYLLEMNAPINESNANSTLQILRNVNWTTNSLTNLTLDVNKTTTAQANLLTNDSVFLPANVCVNNEVLEWDNDGNPICKYKCDTPVYKDTCGDHGECSFTYGGVLRCICKDGYSGNKCETPKPTTTIKPDAIALSKIDIIGIAGGIGGGLVLILLVALCCVYTKLNKAKKRDRFYGYMDNDKEFLHDENSRIENVPDLKNEYTNLGYQTEQNELQMQRFEPEGKNVEYEPGQRQGAYERDDKAYRQVEEPEGGNVLIYQPKHLNGPMERQSGASKFDEVEERSNPYRMMDTDTTYKIRRPTVNSDRNVPYN